MRLKILHLVIRQENDFNTSVIHVIARKSRALNRTVHGSSHALVRKKMSGKIPAKKLQENNVSMQRYVTRKSQTHSSCKVGVSQPKLERKAPSTSVSAAESRSHGLESRRMKDGHGSLSKHSSHIGKEDGKLRLVKHDGKTSSFLSCSPISQKPNSSVFGVKDGKSGYGRAEEPSPRLKNITEASSVTVLSTSIKTDVSHGTSKTKPKGRKQTSGHVAQKQKEEMLPKITINEVLQSWKIEQPRNRSSSVGGKDPMEFLRRDASLSESSSTEKTLENLWKCRYLRLGKEDPDVHGYCCSCNSCEHGDGLRSTAYLNS